MFQAEYFNERFVEIYRIAREKVMGRDVFWEEAYQDPVYREEIRKRVLADCASGDSRKMRWNNIPITRKGERTTYISAQNIPVPGKKLMISTVMDVTEQKEAEDALRQSRENIRALSQRLSKAAESERGRLARELHDQVGQSISSIGINLSIAKDALELGETSLTASRLEDAIAQVEETGRKVRVVMQELRPLVLDDYGLLAALKWFALEFGKRVGLLIKVTGGPTIDRLPPEMETSFFRIAQEALNNVAKHAKATEVDLDLCTMNGNGIRMTISDNGIGFNARQQSTPDTKSHLGMVSMSERALSVGGTCRVESEPGKGTRIIVEASGTNDNKHIAG